MSTLTENQPQWFERLNRLMARKRALTVRERELWDIIIGKMSREELSALLALAEARIVALTPPSKPSKAKKGGAA